MLKTTQDNGKGRRRAEDPGSIGRARSLLRSRLQERRGELEQAIRTRVYGIADSGDADPAYLEGLNASIANALDYALEAIERGEERTPPPPPALLAQARMAARSGVRLDTVLRRYLAGYTLIGDFIAEEAERGALPEGVSPPQLLRGRAALLDRLLAAVSEEYAREAAIRARSSGEHRAQRVARLLAGEPLSTSEFEYDFNAHHTALIVIGSGATEAVRDLAAALDRRLLLVRRDEELSWAWLGARQPLDFADLERALLTRWPAGLTIALGESAQGLAGWRLTHRQAAAVIPIARQRCARYVRYADVALLAAVVQDEVLVASLQDLYLTPLEREQNGRGSLLETLQAYFRADRNVSSAAVALGVSRNTVARRLRSIETKLDRRLDSNIRDLEAALDLHAFLRQTPPRSSLAQSPTSNDAHCASEEGNL